MNIKEYKKEIKRTLKHYDTIIKKYSNSSGNDLLLIIQERNNCLIRITELYYTKGK